MDFLGARLAGARFRDGGRFAGRFARLVRVGFFLACFLAIPYRAVSMRDVWGICQIGELDSSDLICYDLFMVRPPIDKMSQTANVTRSDAACHSPVTLAPQVRDMMTALPGMPDAVIEGMNANREENIMRVPTLDIDRKMLNKYGRKVSPNGRIERRIVAALIAHMEAQDFLVTTVFDGEETTGVSGAKEAMELIFNLDEASLRFQYHKNGDRKRPMFKQHGVLLILGNGEDIISDWNYMLGDHDGFNLAIQAFDVSEVL